MDEHPMKHLTFFLVALAVAGLAIGCDDGGPATADGGTTPGIDGGGTPPGVDGGGTTPGVDGGGTPGVDGGGTPGVDGGGTPPGTDGGGIPTRMGAVGAACTMDGDCTEPADSTCVTDVGGFYEFPGGYCTKQGCAMGSADCGAGAECVGSLGFTFCAKTCASDADCRTAEGYTCQPPPFSLGGGSSTYCLPGGGGTPGFGDGGFGFGDGGLPFP